MITFAGLSLLWSSWRFVSDGTLIGVGLPWVTLLFTYLGVISYRYATEGREKRFLRSALEHYLNPDVIAAVVANPDSLKLGGQRRHLSILFADIVAFSSRAESTEPEQLVSLLNTFMTTMTNVVLKGGGVVDKLIGDGIMAFWGAPLAAQNSARDAIACALGMLKELNGLADRDDRFKDLRIGIGIATGDAVVGNVGGENRFTYSAIGDVVNLASRMEGLTRHFNVDILVDKATFEEAGPVFVARRIGLVRVKGRQQPVSVIEIASRKADSLDDSYYRRFTAALDLIGRGCSAASDLRALQSERPDDRVATMYLDLLERPGCQSSDQIVFQLDTK
jgi:adenylate cyclase